MLFAPGLLSGRVAVVTGGGTGIGRGIALELARVGATVVVAGRRPEPLGDVAREIERHGVPSLARSTDVRDWDQVQALVSETVERFGTLDILVNNAGGQFPSGFEELSPKGWKAVLEVNLNGVFHCTRAAAETMIQQRRGKVINIVTGFTRRAAPGLSHSGAARAAVENLTRSLALEWAPHNIQLNCISPVARTEAFARTAQQGPDGEDTFLAWVPAGRYASVEEVGWLAVFLASPGGDYITGEHIMLDGGYWLSVGIGSRFGKGGV
ncbi:MAG TPA: SDR family oxidoreductase [Gemmatimonadales bacterium]|nr:SDR family oxidoreductase [Gemmatimonadales bacterium]